MSECDQELQLADSLPRPALRSWRVQAGNGSRGAAPFPLPHHHPPKKGVGRGCGSSIFTPQPRRAPCPVMPLRSFPPTVVAGRHATRSNATAAGADGEQVEIVLPRAVGLAQGHG